jgi:SAM-dependent methyltransferase
MNRNPRVSDRYLGEQGSEYCAGYSLTAPAMAVVRARPFQRFIRDTDTVLDFGCATGEVLEAIRCSRRVGVEVNPAFLSRLQAKGIEAHTSLTEVAPRSIDVAISGHVLEHCLRPLDELTAIRQTLRDGGLLVLVVPIDDWRAQRRYITTDLNHHLYTWTPLLLGNLLSEAGFEIDRVDVVTHATPPRGAYRLWRLLPHWVFDGLCVLCAGLLRRRQLQAVARVAIHS